MLNTVSVHPIARHILPHIGKRIFNENSGHFGIVTAVSARRCAACGFAPCYYVKWNNGKMTKPCARGVTLQPDGTLKID